MLGRGILKNPFLPVLLKKGSFSGMEEKSKILRNFYEEILYNYSKLLSGNDHLLMRMKKFWSYFSFSFNDPHKTFKRIKKADNMGKI